MFSCVNCSYSTNLKANYEKHLNRKIPCDKEKETSFKCSYCEKNFTQKGSLNTHLNNRCKEKQLKESKELEELRERVSQINIDNSDNSVNTTNNIDNSVNTVNNTTNNINIHNTYIVDFGKEDFSGMLDEKVIQYLLYSGEEMLYKMILEFHYNPLYPEFNNVHLSRRKDKLAEIIKDGIIVKEKVDKIVKDFRQYITKHLNGPYERVKEELCPSLKEMYERQKYLYENNDKFKSERIKQHLIRTMDNNKEISGKTFRKKRKELKQDNSLNNT